MTKTLSWHWTSKLIVFFCTFLYNFVIAVWDSLNSINQSIFFKEHVYYNKAAQSALETHSCSNAFKRVHPLLASFSSAMSRCCSQNVLLLMFVCWHRSIDVLIVPMGALQRDMKRSENAAARSCRIDLAG